MLLLCACGGSNSAGETITLCVDGNGMNEMFLGPILVEFERQNPEIELIVEYLPVANIYDSAMTEERTAAMTRARTELMSQKEENSMKRKFVFMAAMVLSIGCMAVPVAASENVVDPAGVAAEASIYSPLCPSCEAEGRTGNDAIGIYVSQFTDDMGHTIVYRDCEHHGLYHYYSS